MRVATLFDGNHIAEARVCLRSALEHGAVEVIALALDAEAEAAVAHQPDVHVLPLAELERAFPALAPLRATRSWQSYVGGLKPFLLGHLLRGGPVVLVDSDVWFVGPVAEIDDALGEAVVLVVDRELDPPARCGRFNDGFIAASPRGGRFVEWWQRRCTEWCEWMRPGPGGAFQAEGYLDRLISGRCYSARAISDARFNLAPWNAGKHSVEQTAAGWRVDTQQLVCYHFRDFPDAPTPRGYEALYRAYAEALG